MSSYKILHLIGGGEIGGAERHVFELLSGLDPQVFSPLLGCLTTGPFADLARQSGVRTETFPMKHPLDLRTIFPLLRWAEQEKPALLHAHGSRANLLGRLAAKKLGIPCISTVHSSLATDYLSPQAARLAITLDRLTLPLSAGIIAVSDYIADEVQARGARHVRTIYNGIPPLPPSEPDIQRLRFRETWNIPNQSVVIGCVARLHPAKGHAYLIEAMARLQVELPNTHLLLVGDGPLYHELREEIQHRNLSYTMTGFLPEGHRALAAMDLFVLPSISEGMGLVLLEAMQARIPIVAAATGGIPEVVRANQDAVLVPPADSCALADACLQILKNKELAATLVASAARRWQDFSLENMLAQTENFYREILK